MGYKGDKDKTNLSKLTKLQFYGSSRIWLIHRLNPTVLNFSALLASHYWIDILDGTLLSATSINACKQQLDIH